MQKKAKAPQKKAKVAPKVAGRPALRTGDVLARIRKKTSVVPVKGPGGPKFKVVRVAAESRTKPEVTRRRETSKRKRKDSSRSHVAS